jgi:hypothetical protein
MGLAQEEHNIALPAIAKFQKKLAQAQSSEPEDDPIFSKPHHHDIVCIKQKQPLIQQNYKHNTYATFTPPHATFGGPVLLGLASAETAAAGAEGAVPAFGAGGRGWFFKSS